jgi:Superinfection immunity protein
MHQFPYVCVWLIEVALYFIPAIRAVAIKHSATKGITIANLLIGWTGIGWIIVLLWAWKDTSITAREDMTSPSFSDVDCKSQKPFSNDMRHTTGAEQSGVRAIIYGALFIVFPSILIFVFQCAVSHCSPEGIGCIYFFLPALPYESVVSVSHLGAAFMSVKAVLLGTFISWVVIMTIIAVVTRRDDLWRI